MTQNLVKILQCDTRYFTLTAARIRQLEEVFKTIPSIRVDVDYDEITEKYQYILIYYIGEKECVELFQSRNRGDAFCKLVLKTPALHEPVRVKYNELVRAKYSHEDKRVKVLQRQEEKYRRKLELIEKLKAFKS